MPDLEANKRLARAYFDAFLAADAAWWDRHVDPGFRRHDPGLPFEVVGPAGLRRLADALRPAIPDMTLPIEDVVAEGDRVLVRLRVRGTHGGDLLGVPATGRAIDIAVMDLFRIGDGRLVEHWALLDNLGLLRQVGVTAI